VQHRASPRACAGRAANHGGIVMTKAHVRCLFFFLASILGAPAAWAAIEITTGPTLTMDPYGVAPLTALVEVTTNIPTEATLEITDGIDSWRVRFPDLAASHVLPVLGLKPDRAYSVDLILSAPGEADVNDVLLAPTDPLPLDFPTLTVFASDPLRMEPGFTLTECMRRSNTDPRQQYTIAVDAQGEVVWYLSRCLRRGVQQIANGNLIHLLGNSIAETNMLGLDVNLIPTAYPGDSGTNLHHELRVTPEGTYLGLSRSGVVIDDFPTSETDPDAPTATTLVADEPVVEFAADGSLLYEWFMSDLIDPTRIGYDSLSPTPVGVDWVHANGISLNPDDDSLIVSLRHQDTVAKFDRTTGTLIWILAPHSNWSPAFQPYLLQPVGAPFAWAWHQHSPVYTAARTIVMFDNSIHRASPFDGNPDLPPLETWSRAVEYEVDEQNMEVRQLWEYGDNIAERLTTTFQGGADWLPTMDNILITFSAVTRVGGVYSGDLGLGELHARIVEADHGTPAREVFDLRIHDPDGGRITIYRSKRIPSLYPPDVVVEAIQPGLAAPGSVLDGLRVDKAATGEVILDWAPSCIASDTDYEVYEGQVGDFTSHSQAFCSTAGQTTKTFMPYDGNWYYLVVPHNGSEEGSYGTDSDGLERPQASSACRVQTLGVCP
jgi:arylsulfate sulfotransferase